MSLRTRCHRPWDGRDYHGLSPPKLRARHQFLQDRLHCLTLVHVEPPVLKPPHPLL